MKYRKTKLICGLVISAMVMTSFTACGTSQKEESSTEAEKTANTFVYTDGTEEDTVSTTVTGTVQSVDDNEITLSIGGGMMQGDAPEKPDGDSTGSDSGNGDSDSGDSGNPPAKPEGDSSNSGNDSGSDTSEGAPQQPETATALLTIQDESVISVMDSDGNAEDGSLSDITEGKTLQIVFDENGDITSITVSDGMGQNMAMGGADCKRIRSNLYGGTQYDSSV